MINNKLKQVDIKNYTYYYFDDIINIKDFNLDNKSYKDMVIYDGAYKTPYGAKPLHSIFDKVDGYIRKNDATNYLALFHSDEKYERIYDRIRCLIMLKTNISDVYSHKNAKIYIHSDDELPLEKNIKYA